MKIKVENRSKHQSSQCNPLASEGMYLRVNLDSDVIVKPYLVDSDREVEGFGHTCKN
jgi:hypothetical protein